MALNQTFKLWNGSAFDPDLVNEENATTATIVIVNCLLNIPLMLISIFGNTMVLTAVVTTPSLRSPSIILLCSLAVSDLAVGLIVQPIYIAKELTSVYFLQSLTRTIAVSFCGISFATMAMISVDRFLALRYHMTYNTLVTTARVIYTLIIIWLIHLVLLSGVKFWYPTVYVYMGYTLVGIYIAASTISYIGIYRIVRRHQLQIQVQQQAGELSNTEPNPYNLVPLSRTAVNTFVFYICTILCYFPWFIYRLCSDNLVTNTAGIFTATLVFSNSAINPFLYCWRLSELRAAVMKTLRKMSCN